MKNPVPVAVGLSDEMELSEPDEVLGLNSLASRVPQRQRAGALEDASRSSGHSELPLGLGLRRPSAAFRSIALRRNGRLFRRFSLEHQKKFQLRLVQSPSFLAF
jgi:hypothetical protein